MWKIEHQIFHITKQIIKKNPEAHLIMKSVDTMKSAKKILKKVIKISKNTALQQEI